MSQLHLWENRTLCEVLDEMRQCHKTRSYGYLPGLIEELQSMGNRMESGLGDIRDIKKISQRKRELKKEIKTLEKKFKDLGGETKSDRDS